MRSFASLAALAVLVLGAAVRADGAANNEAASKGYEILSTIKENDSPVAVVRRSDVLFLLYDKTIIGAEFDHPYLRQQAAYPGFAIMQCVKYLDRDVQRAVQVGLGIGTVPTFLRDAGIPTDVVEISSAVVRQAANYFQYERCEPDDPEDCDRGTTYLMDGLKFIDDAPAGPLYDAFIIDVYTGWNPVAFFVKEVIDAVHAKWLKPRGVFVMNFVGFINGEHAAVPKSLLKTLRTSYAHVKVYREVRNEAETGALNIVFFASDEPFKFNVPTDGDYVDPPDNTYFDVVANFQQWEIFTDLDAETNDQLETAPASIEVEVVQPLDGEEVHFTAATAGSAADTKPAAAQQQLPVQVLTKEDHGADVYRATHEFTQAHMKGRVLEQFPPEMWTELGIPLE